MSRLLALQKSLQDTNTAISRTERAVALHPDIPSGAATLRGFIKMRESLEAQFLVEADRMEMDACSYRVMPEGSRPTLAGISAVLGDFQRLFTIVYDAGINGPKQVAKVADNVVDATSLGFAYTFPGSVGFMLTLENKRLLVGNSALDTAMNGVFELMSVTTTGDVSAASQRWGVAALRIAHEWAKANSDAKFGADITWLRKDRARSRLHLEKPEIDRLATTISQTTASAEREVYGEITMVDWDLKTFRMKVEGEDIAGSFFEGAIDPLNPVSVPGHYTAIIRTIRTVIASEEGLPTYVLVLVIPDSG